MPFQAADEARSVANQMTTGPEHDKALEDATALQEAADVLHDAVTYKEILFVTTTDSIWARAAWDIESPWIELGSALDGDLNLRDLEPELGIDGGKS